MSASDKEYRNIWVERVSRWRRLPQDFGKWWWWMWLNMQLSHLPHLGRLFTWLASLPLGPYRGKWPLARITSKSYISPRAQIGCPDLHVSPRCFIDDFVTIASGTEGGSVILDEEVYIYRGTIVEVNRGAKVTIGKDTHIQANCILNGLLGDLRIGRNVMIAPHCGFFSYQHKVDDLSQPMCKQELISKGDIVIEDDVWLGMGVKVMDGVRIGRGAVVGAGAVVTQDIPPYGVAVGVPARIIRKRDVEKPQDVA
ncbi:MAG: acyltransferase [Chloroflexi bacterium]|nr:acyltransferase [Chloroflexota bacterium]